MNQNVSPNLRQQVGEGVVEAIWSWEMPPYKYILLNGSGCLPNVGPVLTSDPTLISPSSRSASETHSNAVSR